MNLKKLCDNCPVSCQLKLIKQKLKEIEKWPDPEPGAGIGLGALAGAGMYQQYKFDREKHEEQIKKIIEE